MTTESGARKRWKEMSQEERDAIAKRVEEDYKIYNETFGKGYGTPDSWCLEKIRDLGFKPIKITVLACEQTFIFETDDEASKAHKAFQERYDTNEGWWYGLNDGKYSWSETVITHADAIGKIYDLK